MSDKKIAFWCIISGLLGTIGGWVLAMWESDMNKVFLVLGIGIWLLFTCLIVVWMIYHPFPKKKEAQA